MNSNRTNEEGENGKFLSFKAIQFIFTQGKLQLEWLYFSQVHVVGFNPGN